MPIFTQHWIIGEKVRTQKANNPDLDLAVPIAVWLWANYLTFLSSFPRLKNGMVLI